MMASPSRVLRYLFSDSGAIDLPIPVGHDILDKQKGLEHYISYMLDRTNSMFEWSGLPSTITSHQLELYLQVFGYAAFVQVDETMPIHVPKQISTPPGLYIFCGGVGGERDIYYRPKLFTAANPRLKGSIQSTILYEGDDPNGIEHPCVLMGNDHEYMGLLPLYNRYAQQMVENDISIRSAQINSRAQVGIEAMTDRDKESARKYLDDLEAGKIGLIGETPFLDGIRVSNISTHSPNTIIQLIELQQYLKASWYNELGLNVNFNMKREYMSEEEIAVNTDILLPLVDDMLNTRREAAEIINKVFGLNVSVEKSSAWANKEQEELAALAESSNAGGIPLSSQVLDKIGGDMNDKDVQQEVKSEVPEVESASAQSPVTTRPDFEPQQGDGNAEQDASNVNGEPAVVVNINVNGGDIDELSVQESGTLAKSEESDAESNPT